MRWENMLEKEMGRGVRHIQVSPAHLEEGLDIMVGKMKKINEEAQELIKTMDDEVALNYVFISLNSFTYERTSLMSQHKFAIDNGEDTLKALILTTMLLDTVTFKRTGGKQNWYRSGLFLYQLCFQYGCLPELDVWHGKVIKDYAPLKLDQKHNYSVHGSTTVAPVGDLTITASTNHNRGEIKDDSCLM